MSHVVVLMTDSNYVSKAIQTIQEIRTIGEYTGDIVLLCDSASVTALQTVEEKYKIQRKVFDPIDLSHIMSKIQAKPFTTSIDRREHTKPFQWHKLHIFDTFFRQWDMVFYIDAGMKILKPLALFMELFDEYKKTYPDSPTFLAHSDSYPTYEWKLNNQFEAHSYPDVFQALGTAIDLQVDYFQTTTILFDTCLITDQTKQDLIDLMNTYYISKTNEQGIMNVYFNGIHNLWKPLPVYYKHTYTYDYWNRGTHAIEEYSMLKYTH